jgi:hypothetical protein
VFHTATLLLSGEVLIAGGDTSPNTTTASAELSDPATATFSAVGDMKIARDFSVAALFPTGPFSGQVIEAGGGGNADPTATAELFDPATNTFTLTGSLTTVRSFPVAALLKTGKYLVAGGGGVLSVDLFDPSTGKFTATGNMNSGHALGTATLLPSGQVMIIAGATTGGIITPAVDLFNPASETFAVGPPLLQFRESHGASLLGDGHVLV